MKTGVTVELELVERIIRSQGRGCIQARAYACSRAEHRAFEIYLQAVACILEPPRRIVKFVDLLFQLTQPLFEDRPSDKEVPRDPYKFVETGQRDPDDMT